MARKKSQAPARESKPAPVPARSVAVISEQEIAERAYQRWQERGCPIGDDMRDWFEAREELSQERE